MLSVPGTASKIPDDASSIHSSALSALAKGNPPASTNGEIISSPFPGNSSKGSVTVPLASSHMQAYFRSINQYFEWVEDDQGGRTEIQTLPKDDVLESLKRKDQSAAAGDGLVAAEGVSFKEMIVKTVKEYEKILDTKKYKDLDDKLRLEKTIKDLKKQLESKA